MKIFMLILICFLKCNASNDSDKNFQISEYLIKRTISISLEPKTVGNSWTGTGFFVSKSGHILTAAHVLKGNQEVYLSYQNKVAKVIASDLVVDLALLKVDLGNEEVDFLDVNHRNLAKYGERVYSMGTPFGESDSFFIANISKPNVFGGDPTEPNRTYVQVDRIFFPGFSGAPLINSNYELIGMARYQLAVSETKHSGLGYAIHSATIAEFMKKQID